MKKLTQKIIIGSLIGLPMISNAQFSTNPPFFNYGFTNPASIQKIGIGNFPNNASVQAKFHISQFLLAPNAATNGFMFRTDGSNTVSNSWQLFTGATTGSVTEKFRLFVPANSNDATLQTTQNGIMRFNTNNINRMTVFGNGTLNTDGRIAMGNNLPLGFTPTARLHLHQTEPTLGLVSTTTKYTDLSTGFNANDGFEVGYSSSSTIPFSTFAQLRNRENTPMKFFTTNRERIHVNANRTVTLDGYNVPTNGFVGIGNPSQGLNPGLWDQRGPFSLLHLNGRTGFNSFVFAGGYRPWMRTGITFSDQIDLGYVGLRSVFPPGNINEMVINMSNDPLASFGPDDIVFRFSVAGNGNTTIDDDFDVYNDLDGRHLARFTGSGDFGLGPVFGVVQSNPNYVRPASLQHLSLMKLRSVYTQYTNRDDLINTGTEETVSDGLRIGIRGEQIPLMNGNAILYNQETRHLLFSTDVNTNNINIATGNTLERMRITSISAPTNLAGGGYGVNNPAGLNGEITRVAISLDPNNPITRPLSLLHLGQNTVNPNNDGWRDWMNVGTFTSDDIDNIYVGLKNEGSTQDAVVNWGSDSLDNLRFIFTENLASSNPNGGAVASGLEVARFDPKKASTLPTPNYGMMGIGDFSPTGPNTAAADVVDAKLDIDGDLRIRHVTEDTTLLQVLVIDSNDHNRVHWRSISDFGGGVGNYCSDPQNPLISSYEVPLNNFNYYFSGNGLPNTNSVSVGTPCSTILPAKFNSYQNAGFNVGVNTSSGNFLNEDIANTQSLVFTGVSGIAQGMNSLGKVQNRGGYFTASNANDVRGVVIELIPSANNNGGAIGGEFNITSKANINIGVAAFTSGNISTGINIGVFGRASGSDISNIGASFIATTPSVGQNIGVGASAAGSSTVNIAGSFITSLTPTTTGSNIAVLGRVGTITVPTIPANNAIAIYGNSDSPLNNGVPGYAGYFDGNVYINGPSSGLPGFALTSDVQFKTDIDTIINAGAIISQLIPRTYYFDTTNVYGLNFNSKKQYGLVAQEVEPIMPELISEITKAPMIDTLGNLVTPGITYKALNYNAFIAILMKGMQEQQSQIDSMNVLVATQDSINTDLEDRLTTLEACINNIGICNNNGGGNGQGNNRENTQTVTLQNLNAIILDQNLPNPFAESTQINYVLPDDVLNAKMLFYDMNGRIINEVNINERGNGTLTVYGENLEKGIYTYSLIADGKLIATKKMVKK